ncbi:MAG: hypothetical protein ACRDG3_12530 [Tepidiformaceae bacterium]
MSHAVAHATSPFRALYSQAAALRDPIHRRSSGHAASLRQAAAQASGTTSIVEAAAIRPVSLTAARLAARGANYRRRNTVVRITNALGLFAALYAAVVLMRFAG